MPPRILLAAALALLLGGSLVQAAEPGSPKLERAAHFGDSRSASAWTSANMRRE
jgi:hypothetical protein